MGLIERFSSDFLDSQNIPSIFQPKIEDGCLYTDYEFQKYPNVLERIHGKSYIFINENKFTWYEPFLRIRHLGGGERYGSYRKSSSDLFYDFFIFFAVLFVYPFQYLRIYINNKIKVSKQKKFRSDYSVNSLNIINNFFKEDLGNGVIRFGTENWYKFQFFDSNNLLKKSSTYDSNDNLQKEVIYEYDVNNLLVSRILNNFQEKMKATSAISFLDDLIVKEEIVITESNKKVLYEIFISYNNISNVNNHKDFLSITCKKDGMYLFLVTKSLEKIF
jgi:hypothetical protein